MKVVNYVISCLWHPANCFSVVISCRDGAILSETGFSSRKSRQLVSDTSELVRNVSQICSLACARGQDSVINFDGQNTSRGYLLSTTIVLSVSPSDSWTSDFFLPLPNQNEKKVMFLAVWRTLMQFCKRVARPTQQVSGFW